MRRWQHDLIAVYVAHGLPLERARREAVFLLNVGLAVARECLPPGAADDDNVRGRVVAAVVRSLRRAFGLHGVRSTPGAQ